jgi:hypothetical protein
MLELIRRRRKQ